ncbi:ComEC/Rec2 family competence protein [Asaia spathodeae]|uniref:ComEC/Rec2 family competence protein n=1 Tax=Asaia spathodeae TaxID=657016 RepID=A0ABX2P5B9_9PROT|nr:ComEC/Rec2 family competence protein [Asaia spathodeae]GBR12238.1 DNA translocation competence protein ComA/ComEC/Rec2 [Asaia spathodeae NBRC 105894]
MIPARLAAFVESCLLGQGRALVAWLPVAWAIGSLLYFLPLHEPGYGRASLCGFSGLMLLISGWRRLTARGLGFVVLLVSLGFLAARGQAWRQPPMPALPSIAVTMHGVIADVSSHGEEGHVVQRLRLSQAVFETGVDIGMAPLKRDLLLFTHDEQNYAPGMVVRLNAVLRPPDWPDFPGGRDRQMEGWFDGLAGTGRVLGVPDIVQAPQGHALGRWRLHIAAVIATHLSGQRAAIASTLLAGHGEGISQKTRDAYAASGLAHILAVAGLHLGLVMGAVFVMTRQALVLWPWLGLRLPCREIAALTALASGLIYVALTGFHLPALRSLGMAGLATLALLTGRRVLSMRSLALVALVLLMASPVLVLDLSFQMSFAAVMALIAGYEALRPHFVRRAEQGKKNGPGHHLALLSLTSALAGGATLPLVMAGFGSFQPWFILANLVAVPVAAFCVMPAGLLALLLMPFGLSGPPLWVMGQGIGLISSLAECVASFPLAHVPVPHMGWEGLALYMAGLAGFCLWRGRARFGFLPLLMLGVVSPVLGESPLVLVSPDAGVIAFQQDGHWVAGPHNGLANRVLEAWQRAWPLPVMMSSASPACTASGCTLALPLSVSLWFALPSSESRAAACQQRGFIVSAVPLPEDCRAGGFIDRFTVWRDGAVLLRVQGNRLKIVSDRSWRGARLWVPRVGFRGVPNLPMAQAE